MSEVLAPFRTAPADEPRTARLGASEVAAVLGMARFSTPLTVWERKTGRAGASPDTAVTRRGRFLENGLLSWLAAETGATSAVPGSAYTAPYVVGDAPHIGAHPDGYLCFDNVGVTPWEAAEVKTARDAREYGEEGDEIPDDYYIQVQVQLACTGLQAARFGVYLPMRDEFRAFRIVRDDDVIRSVIDRAEAWWQRHVVGDTPPEAADPSEMARSLFYRYPRESGVLREATEHEADVIRALADAKQARKVAEAMEEDLAAGVKALIGADAGIVLPGGKATWKAQESTRIDVTRLRAELPDVADRFSVTTPSRVLRVTVK